MSDKIRIEYGYRMEGHYAVGAVDTEFYRNLPNVDKRYINQKTGRTEVPRPDVIQTLTIVGMALLSSTVLATAIKSYLQSRRTKIKIAIKDNNLSVEYEGPNLKDSEEAIKETVDYLLEKAGHRTIHLSATKITEIGE